jgi:DNA-directed RNA polymerase subunit F
MTNSPLRPKQSIQNSELKTQHLIVPSEDFWSRQANQQSELFECVPFGIPARITANQTDVLIAAQLSTGRFSRTDQTKAEPIAIKIVVRPGPDNPVPDDLPEQLVYSGVDDWISVSAGAWGHAFANLQSREAVLFLSERLAAKMRLVSRYFIDHYLLNFILLDWAMLHASCVLSPDGQQLIVMIAPHNTGKSTTALHLLRAGFHFLADGMALLRHTGDGFLVGGYPIGEVKLRDDVLDMFPEYSGQTVRVREHRKTVVDLRSAHANRVAETLLSPASIQLYFVERHAAAQAEIVPLDPNDVTSLLAENTIFWDTKSRLEVNSHTLQTLLRVANVYRLTIGTDTDSIVAAIRDAIT